MNLRYILGVPGSGKTTMCLQEVADSQAIDGCALIYIVPEQASLSAEKMLINMAKNRVISSAKVLSFARLSYFVLKNSKIASKKILEDNGKHMLLRRAVGRLSKSLVYYRGAAEKSGFIDLLARMMSEFYHYSISPQNLEIAAKSLTKSLDGNLALKLQDLAAIYSEYQKYIEDNYIAADEILDILAEEIPKADFIQGAKIWIDGFKSFTPQELKVLKSLMQSASQMSITFTLDKKPDGANSKYDVFFEPKDSIRRINDIAGESGEQIFLEKSLRENESEISFLAENYLCFDIKKYPHKPKNIEIFATKNIRDEVHVAAKKIVQLTRLQDYSYNQIGVICADLTKYAPYIRAIFADYHIPLFIDSRTKPHSHPLIKLVLFALDTIANHFRYSNVFAFLRSGFDIIDSTEADMLENYVLAYGIRGKAWMEDFVFGSNTYNLIQLNDIRNRIITALQPLLSFGGRKNSVGDISRAIYEFLQHINATATMQKWLEQARIDGDNQLLRTHEQVWGLLMDALDKIVEILGDSSERISDYRKILSEGIADLALAPPSIDQLIVGDLRRSRLDGVKALILLGATDDLLPSSPISGMLDDADRQILASTGIELAKDSLASIHEEELLIYTNLTKPSEYIGVSYHYGDLEGKGASPGPVISRIGELFPDLEPIDLERISPNSMLHFTSASETFGKLIVQSRKSIERGGELPSLFKDSLMYFKKHEEHSVWLQNFVARLGFGLLPGVLSKDTVGHVYKNGIRSSVSRLERYMACPFSYFVQYNLGAKERKLFDAGAIDLGNIYHDAIANLSDILQSDLKKLSQDEIEKIAKDAMESAVNATENGIFTSSGRYMNMAARAKEIGQASAIALAHHLSQGGFRLEASEVSFGELTGKQDMGNITIGLPSGAKMLLGGRIDRVDLLTANNDNYVKIIDYKSGAKEFSYPQLLYGLDLQLIIYIGAFLEKMNEISPQKDIGRYLPAAALFFNLQNPIIDHNPKLNNPENIGEELLKSFKMTGIALEDEGIRASLEGFIKSPKFLSQADFAKLIHHALSVVKKAGQSLAEGDISVSPYRYKQDTPCRYCKFRSICKYDPKLDRHKERALNPLKPADALGQMLL